MQSLKLLLGKMLGNLFLTLLAFATCPKAERGVQVSLSPRHPFDCLCTETVQFKVSSALQDLEMQLLNSVLSEELLAGILW